MLLEVDGTLTADWQARLREASTVGIERFHDEANSFQEQQVRLKQLEGHSRGLKLDGQASQGISLFNVVNARAKMKTGTSGSDDLLVPEILRHLPLTVAIRISELFEQRQLDLFSPDPPSWKIMRFVGLPKVRNAFNLKLFRWIGKLSVFLKWCIQSLRPAYSMQMRPSSVHTYGFRRGRRTDDVAAVLKEVLCHASTW